MCVREGEGDRERDGERDRDLLVREREPEKRLTFFLALISG